MRHLSVAIEASAAIEASLASEAGEEMRHLSAAIEASLADGGEATGAHGVGGDVFGAAMGRCRKRRGRLVVTNARDERTRRL